MSLRSASLKGKPDNTSARWAVSCEESISVQSARLVMLPEVLFPQFGPSHAVARRVKHVSAKQRAIKGQERIGLSAVAVDAKRLS
jgi:hypothetical protein